MNGWVMVLSLVVVHYAPAWAQNEGHDGGGSVDFHDVCGLSAHGQFKLILSLENKVGEVVVSQIDLFANDIDPNLVTTDDEYCLEIDGNIVKAPKELLFDLDTSRKAFSYDHFTGGLRSFYSGSLCQMAGEPAGSILRARYLTYQDHRIVDDEMRAVYSENRNCLFTEGFAPNKKDSEKAAAKTMAILQTIMTLKSTPLD
jgi:hypothetical protein